MDETLRIIDNLCEDISPFPVHVSWNCLESTLSSSDVEVATSRHSGCRTWIWSRFCRASSEHPERETGCYTWLHIWQVEICTLYPMLLRPYISAAHNAPRCARWIHARIVFNSAWLQQPLRKNPCRSNDRRNSEQGHTDAMGTKGFSLNLGAVSRYYFTAEYRAVYMITLRDMIGQGSSKLPHPDLQGPRIRKDEAYIKSLIDLMENNWLNQLSPDTSDLVSLSTGSLDPPAVIKDLQRALEMGEEAYQTCRWTRLDDDTPSV